MSRPAGRWIRLILGLLGFGLAIPLMIRSGLGLGPWDAFHVGVHHLTGLSVGTVSMLAGALIVAGSLRLGIRPGPGTLINMVLVGVSIDVVLPLVPAAANWAVGLGYYALAIVVVGISTGMYIGAGLGNGPRDGLMIGISRSRGWSVRRVRTLIELSVLGAGWAMGGEIGVIGVGTVIFALASGPATQWGLSVFRALPATPPATAGRWWRFRKYAA